MSEKSKAQTNSQNSTLTTSPQTPNVSVNIKESQESSQVSDDAPVVPVAKKFIQDRIKAERKLASEQPNKDKYFIFMTPDCGRSYYTAAGISWPVFHTELQTDMTGQEFESPVRGQVSHLSESEASRLIEKAKKLKIRFVGESGTLSRSESNLCQDNEWPFLMFAGLYKMSDLVREFPDYLTNDQLPTLQDRDETCIKKFGTGWVDSKGEKIPLKRKFVMEKIEYMDTRSQS